MIFSLLPKNSKPFSTSNIFDAVFNVPTLGKYDYNVPANQGQAVFEMVNTSIYFIRQVAFSATVPEGDFLSSIDTSTNQNFPRWRLRFASDKSIVHPYAFPVVQYYDSTDFETFVWSYQASDKLTVDFLGVLNQIAAFVGVSNIKAQLSLVVYEITDSNFVKQYRDTTKPGFYRI